MNKLILSVIITVIVAGGTGFYAGMHYPANTASGYKIDNPAFSGRLGGNNRVGGGAMAGSIVSEDSQSITVKLANGNTQIAFISTTTPVMKSTQGSISDLSVGQQVVVTGTANPDGSITAQDVQIRPAGTGAFRPYLRTSSSSQ